MDPTCTNIKGIQSSYSSARAVKKEHLSTRYNLRRKKKKYITNRTSDSVDLCVESENNSAGTWVIRNKDNKMHDDNKQKQRNLGSPVIVEALSQKLSLLDVPEALRCNVNQDKHASYRDILYTEHPYSEKDETCVIVAQSINPNDHCKKDSSDRSPTQLKNNSRQQKEKKKLQDTNSDVFIGSQTTSESRQVQGECVENTTFTMTSRNDSFLGIESTIPTVKNQSGASKDQVPVRFYCLRNKVVAVISEGGRFSFTGKVILKVLYGAVEAYGSVITVQTGPIEIYSPRGYSSVSIDASDKFSGNDELNVWPSLRNEGINDDGENKLITEIDQIRVGMAVVLLSNLENNLTKFLNAFYPFRLFPKVTNLSYYSWTDPKRAEVILQSNLYAGRELIIDSCLAQEVSKKMLNRWHANQRSCTLIAGGKNVGKSTAARILINTLLPVSKTVVLVDVDPGQAECTPAGCISYSLIEQPLMGPSFTHLKTPLFQLYIGDVNVTRCLTHYIEGVKILTDKLFSSPVLSRLPIVVNTMGFAQGIGWDIVIFTLKLMRPSFVVQIMSQKSKNNYIECLSWQVINRSELRWASWSRNIVDWNKRCDHELFVIHSQAERKSPPGSEAWNMEPYQQRELAMICYLSKIIQSSRRTTEQYNLGLFSVNETVPYATSFSSLIVSIPRASVPPSHVLNVMNGNIVALCGIDIDSNATQKGATEVVSSLRVLNRSPLCVCYGFGIVRGIDMEREVVFITTPLSASMMRYVNYLVGCIPVPVALSQLNQQTNIPYCGGSDVLPTSREPRRGYFRMRYRDSVE